ncbi:MAG TPA: bacterio-opsin activator [candidate division Zixibacteria bacterium]|nr:bacterio-opsin activator [candidate division Zixibacteria bacterium]
MVVKITGAVVNESELEQTVARVFFKAIDLLGGISNLAEYRALTWLPSLARACYALVLREEYLKTEDEIAQRLGLTKNTVRAILRADPQQAMYKIEHFDELSEQERKNIRVHTAGGIAKLAYKYVREGQDSQVLLEFARALGMSMAQVCEAPWAYIVLKRTRGLKYPVESPEILKERLAGISIADIPAEEVVEGLEYPIRTPAVLLHEIKEYLQMKGK